MTKCIKLKKKPEIYQKVWRFSLNNTRALHLPCVSPGVKLLSGSLVTVPTVTCRGKLTHYLERICESFLGLCFA